MSSQKLDGGKPTRASTNHTKSPGRTAHAPPMHQLGPGNERRAPLSAVMVPVKAVLLLSLLFNAIRPLMTFSTGTFRARVEIDQNLQFRPDELVMVLLMRTIHLSEHQTTALPMAVAAALRTFKVGPMPDGHVRSDRSSVHVMGHGIINTRGKSLTGLVRPSQVS